MANGAGGRPLGSSHRGVGGRGSLLPPRPSRLGCVPVGPSRPSDQRLSQSTRAQSQVVFPWQEFERTRTIGSLVFCRDIAEEVGVRPGSGAI